MNKMHVQNIKTLSYRLSISNLREGGGNDFHVLSFLKFEFCVPSSSLLQFEKSLSYGENKKNRPSYGEINFKLTILWEFSYDQITPKSEIDWNHTHDIEAIDRSQRGLINYDILRTLGHNTAHRKTTFIVLHNRLIRNEKMHLKTVKKNENGKTERKTRVIHNDEENNEPHETDLNTATRIYTREIEGSRGMRTKM